MAHSLSGSNKSTLDLSQDGHIHTRLCNHATGEMEEYVLAALNKNLKTIIFLEHLEEKTVYFERP